MLKILRTIAIGLYIALCMSIGVLVSIVRPRHPNNVWVTSKLLAAFGFKILGIEYDRRNYDLHKEIGPAVFCSNHQNNFDMFPGGSNVQKRTVVLGKTSILWIPFFGQFFWLSGNILINRSNPFKAKKSMEKVTKKITEDGISVWVMPEGTRSRGRGLLPFKKGAFVTAINAQCPIAPVVFSSYAKTLDLNKWNSGKIIAECLPPIPTKGMTKDDLESLMNQTRKAMEDCLNRLDREIYGEA